MRSVLFLACFCLLTFMAQNQSDNAYENKKQECASKNERVFKVKSYLTCIK